MKVRCGETSQHGGEEHGPLLHTPPGELSGGQPLHRQEVGAEEEIKQLQPQHLGGGGGNDTRPRITCCLDLPEEGFEEEESRLMVGAREVCSAGGCRRRRREADGERTRLLSQGGDAALKDKRACGATTVGFSSKRK